jgi:hypothetical protein
MPNVLLQSRSNTLHQCVVERKRQREAEGKVDVQRQIALIEAACAARAVDVVRNVEDVRVLFREQPVDLLGAHDIERRAEHRRRHVDDARDRQIGEERLSVAVRHERVAAKQRARERGVAQRHRHREPRDALVAQLTHRVGVREVDAHLSQRLQTQNRTQKRTIDVACVSNFA